MVIVKTKKKTIASTFYGTRSKLKDWKRNNSTMIHLFLFIAIYSSVVHIMQTLKN